jgi:hypothetical protein
MPMPRPVAYQRPPPPNPFVNPIPKPNPVVEPPPKLSGLENVMNLFNNSKLYIEKPYDVPLKNTLPKNGEGEKILLELLARECRGEDGKGRKFRIVTLNKENAELLKTA